jgi:hypothetical protein
MRFRAPRDRFEALPLRLLAFPLLTSVLASIAQRLEQGSHKPLVPGSNPGARSPAVGKNQHGSETPAKTGFSCGAIATACSSDHVFVLAQHRGGAEWTACIPGHLELLVHEFNC